MVQWYGRVALVILTVIPAAGCQGVSVVRVRRDRSVVRAGDPGGLVGTTGLLADAEARYRAGRAIERRSRETAAVHDLAALTDAAGSMGALGRGRGATAEDPSLARARALYNAALEAFLRDTAGRRMRLDPSWREDLAARGVHVSARRDGPCWAPERFDELLFVDDYAVLRLGHRYAAEGVGVPLIAVRRFKIDEFIGRWGEEKFLMPRQVYPVTAMLRVVPPDGDRAGGSPEYRLELHDPVVESRVAFAGGVQPLAADLSTPLAYHFARSPLPILQEVGLLNPQWLEQLQGLYMLHPYEPGKIPVLLIHGLRSSPVAWMKVINELRGDPALRARYQFWLFMYPTGKPFPASVAELRRALDELRQVVDPDHADPALDRMVLVGHSMGGLIAKMMIQESGDALWKLVASRPFEQLRATPEQRGMLERVFFFHPHPSVRRVVFIATPHRGSELGDEFIGRLADRLIRLPGSLRGMYRALLTQNGPDFFSPGLRDGLPSSIDELRRDNPLLLTLSGLPVAPGVVGHSIIGRQDEDGPLESSSDGVVPYASAHLDWTASECVVRGDHGCQDGPETIREIRRILELHLDPSAGAGVPGLPLDREARRGEPVPIAVSPLLPRPTR